jgi:hypothetical protein
MKKIGILGSLLGLLILLFAAKPLISPTIQPRLGGATWKTHFNAKYGHQLSFPADWQVEEWDIEEAANLKTVPDGTILHQGKFFGKNGHFEILIWENKSRAPVRTWLTWFRHEDLILSNLPQKENFTISGIPVIHYLQKSTSRKKPILYIFFGKDDKIYELTEEREDLIGVEATESARFAHPVYDKIVQSFQFVVK